MRRRLAIGLASVATVAGGFSLGGCGGSARHGSSSATSSQGTTANATRVTIKNFAFSPSPLRVTAGSTITVVNADNTTHTFSADDHSFDTGPIGANATASVTLSHPGTYHYHCNIHNYMQGVIQVIG